MSKEAQSFSTKRHNKFHHPIIEGEELSANPYLYLPFFSSVDNYEITEGWMYSRNEKRIHGYTVHGAVDFHVPYGTDVAAPCDGLAISSYHSFPLLDKDKKIKTLDGKELYFGLGYFIQIYVTGINRYIQLGHFSEIDKSIPFSIPTFENGTWNPTNHSLKPDELPDNKMVIRVRKGQLLGKVGFSGLRWGYDDYTEGATRPVSLDTTRFNSYDEPHLHFEEMGRDSDGKKGWQRDPYAIYLTARNYPTPTRNRKIGEEPLFIIDDNGLPVFAD